MKKYYKSVSKSVIADFESTYDKMGEDASVADLYKLDKYWQMQNQTKAKLQKLGSRTINKMSEAFERTYFDVYNSINIKGNSLFSTIDDQAVKSMINTIWLADGKSFSDRVWKNTDLLLDTLNKELVGCVAAGKKTTQLKAGLQKRFGVSYHNADTIARTEIAHIQTQAAKQRYKDYGIQLVEVFVDEDERTCEICAELEGARYNVDDNIPVPTHPGCRCCIVPVLGEET